MIGSFQSTWTVLWRRAVILGGLLLPVLVTVAATVGVILSATDSSERRGPVRGVALAMLGADDGGVATLRATSLLLGVVVLAVTASAVAQEISLGTLRNVLVREPRRVRGLAGRFTALASFGALVGVVCAVFAVLTSWICADVQGVDTAGWTVAATLEGVGSTVLSLVGYALLGAVLGLVLRSPAAAIGAGAAYLLPVENLTSTVWDAGHRWLPGQLLSSLSEGGDASNTFTRAGLLTLVYVAVLTTASALLFRRRDVAT